MRRRRSAAARTTTSSGQERERTMPADEEFLAYNRGVIDEFRANAGVVSQPDFPVLLLTTTGARTGRRVTTPLGFGVADGRIVVVASKGGGPSHPAWFRNLCTCSDV